MKKNILQRGTALLLSLLMVLSIVNCTTAYAEETVISDVVAEEETTEEETSEEETTEDDSVESDSVIYNTTDAYGREITFTVTEVSSSDSGSNRRKASSTAVTYTDEEEAGEILRAGMVARESEISFTYQITIDSSQTASDQIWSVFSDIMDIAVEHTGNPTEGDYLYWCRNGYSASASYYTYSQLGIYSVTFTCEPSYYTTADQEAELDEAVAALLDDLDLDGKTDYQKILAIYDYMCDNITYDYTNLNDSDYLLKYTAYAALINGTSVCQGYATLFYRLALEVGIDARFINGYGNSGAHGWNIVQLGSLYYYLDATWDASLGSYTYFLKGSTNFLSDHTVGSPSTDFIDDYNISTTDYNPDAVSVEAPVISSVYSTVQTAVKVTWTQVDGADGYQIYRSTEEDGTYICVKTITSGSTVKYTNSGLTIGQTYYYKVRAYVKDTDGSWICSEFSDVAYMPATVVLTKVYSNATYRNRILWNEISGAEGYQIWRSDLEDGTYTIVKTIRDSSTTAYSNTGLTSGKTYYYKMRAFAKDEEGNTVFGTFSDVWSVAVMPETPTVTVTSTSTSKAKITWDAIDGAAGYQIWRSTSEDGTYTIVKSIADGDTVSYTNSGLTSGQTYYYKIRAYSDADGSKTFGDYSDVVSVTAK